MYFDLYILLSLLPLIAPSKMRSTAAMTAIVPGVVISSWGALSSLGLAPQSIYAPSFDGVGALFALLFSFVVVAVVPSVARLMAQSRRTENSIHHTSIVVLYYAMLGVLAAQSVFHFLFYWELMSLMLFTLSTYDSRRREVMHSAVGFFVVMHAAFFVLVGAFCAIPQTGELFPSQGVSIALWVMFLVGFMVKSAIFPFHFWLPRAYCSAPSWVAALMGGTATNIGLYGIVRITSGVDDLTAASLTMIAVGGVSALYGAMRLTSSPTLSRTLAYSSIDNIGLALMALGVGFYGQAKELDNVAFWGFVGAAMQIVMHAVAKATLFISVGNITKSTGSDRTSDLGGLARTMPLSSLGFLMGASSIMALIPAGGFWSEFAIFSSLFSAVGSGIEPVIGIVAITITALVASITIFVFAKSFSIAFLGTPRTAHASNASEKTSTGLLWTISLFGVMLMVAGGGVLLFLTETSGAMFAIQPSGGRSMAINTIASVSLVVGVLVVLIAVLCLVRRTTLGSRINSEQPTWGCANGDTTPDMQYTDESFSAEARATFSLPGAHRSHTASRRFLPVHVMRRLTGRLALIQTGHTSHYIMHIILFLALILILTLVGAI